MKNRENMMLDEILERYDYQNKVEMNEGDALKEAKSAIRDLILKELPIKMKEVDCCTGAYNLCLSEVREVIEMVFA